LEQDWFLPSNKNDTVGERTTTTKDHPSGGGGNTLTDLVQSIELPSATQVWNEIIHSALNIEKNNSSRQKNSNSTEHVAANHNPSPKESILLVDSHGHAHLERESSSEYHVNEMSEHYRSGDSGNDDHNNEENGDYSQILEGNISTPAILKTTSRFLAVSCAVAPDDWQACLHYAAQSNHRIAAVGVHPWYVGDLPHNWLDDVESILQQHARVMVGEIGLCKVARFVRTYKDGKKAALALQRQVFTQQLDLAARYQRPVTVHCVQQQQILLDILKERTTSTSTTTSTGTSSSSKEVDCGPHKALPPAIALHSFTGTAHHVDQLLKWEDDWHKRRRKYKQLSPRKNPTTSTTDDARQSSSVAHSSKDNDHHDGDDDGPLLYFGFSHMVNYAMCSSEKSRKQGRDAIRRVPSNRILAESDVHNSRDAIGGTALACAYLAWALEENDDGRPTSNYSARIANVAQQTTANSLRFLSSLSRAVLDPSIN
jgi:TatD DNase family protein